MPSMELSHRDFERLSSYIHHLCGLHIKEEKRYLIQQRLEPLVRHRGFDSFSSFYEDLVENPSFALHEEIVAAITTNETSFFRDVHPFETLTKHLLPPLGERIKARKREHVSKGSGPRPRIRIWSAGTSTGQEAYSLAMCVHEYGRANHFFGVEPEDFTVLATDISTGYLDRAARGRFTETEVARGLSKERLERHFVRDGKWWVVREEIRRLVEFRKMNLVEPFTLMCQQDLIFCRNVLIYFDESTKKRILDQFHRKLAEGGSLILGSAENMYGLEEPFVSTQMGETLVYKKQE